MASPPLLPALLKDAPIAVASLDLHGRLVDANRALLDAGGYTLDALRGRSFAEFLDADSAADARTQFEALAAGALGTYRAERRYRTANGELRDVELIVSLVREDGGPSGCLAVLQDVTALKTALRDAARRTAELEAAIESMPAAVYISDETGVMAANTLGLKQLGLRSAAELRVDPRQLIERLRVRTPGSRQPMAPEDRSLGRALRGERVDTQVQLTHLEAGGERMLRVVAAPVMLEGRIVGAVAITQDITDQKATEEALRLSEARYRGLVEQSPLSIQILAPGGNTVQVNEAWQRLWGVTLADLDGYNLLEDLQLEDAGLMPTIKDAFAGEPGRLPAIMYDPDRTLPDRSSHDDPRRWVRAVIYPITGPDGAVQEVVLVHEDITEQMHAAEQRRAVERERERLLAETRQAQHDLEVASRVKDEFLAVLSHELRTPLNAVLGWARILRSRPIGEQTAHAVEVIERNAIAQARLIDDLLDLSMIITGKMRLRLGPVDLGAVAADALESVRPAAHAKRIAIDLHVADGIPRVSGDGHRLQQVFWNLMSNAVKFTEPGGSISVSVAMDADNVIGQVSDSGIGVAPEVLPVVFDRFTQADSSSTRAHPGLGLGLAIVRHLVELHGGTVHAASAGRGEGATFRFTLPR